MVHPFPLYLLCLLCMGHASLYAQFLSEEKTLELPELSTFDVLHQATPQSDGGFELYCIKGVPAPDVQKKYTFTPTWTLQDHRVTRYENTSAFYDAVRPRLVDDRGQSYEIQGVSTEHTIGAKLLLRKQTTTWRFYAALQDYYPSVFATQATKVITSEGGHRVYPYCSAEHSKTGDLIAVVGNHAPRTSRIKHQQARHFQLLKVSNDLEVDYKETLEFDYNMCISYARIVQQQGARPNWVGDNVGDLAQGDLALLFSPILTIKKNEYTHPDPGAHTLVIVGPDGAIKAKIALDLPASAWDVENIVRLSSGELIVYGMAEKGRYTSSVSSVRSPLILGLEFAKLKQDFYFQLLRLRPDYSFAHLTAIHFKEIGDKTAVPEGQPQPSAFLKRNFESNQWLVTPTGDLFIAGRRYTLFEKVLPEEEDDDEVKTQTVRVYSDYMIFHCSPTGQFKQCYHLPHRETENDELSVPTYLYHSPASGALYWLIHEARAKRSLITDANEEESNPNVAPLFYYYAPRLAKIDLNNAQISPSMRLGADKRGLQRYFVNPFLPPLHQTGEQVTLMGLDELQKTLWLGKLELR